MKAIAGSAVVSAIRENRARTWWRGGGPSLTSPSEQFEAKSFYVAHHLPKFKLDRSSVVFAIGSCFAHNVEDALVRAGVRVITADFQADPEVYKDPAFADSPRGMLYKYNAHSIRIEIERVLDPAVSLPDDGIVQLPNGKWIDPQATNTIPASREATLATRRAMTRHAERIKDADVVILTLGMTETWLDLETGSSWNTWPPMTFMRSMGERFAFRNDAYPDVVGELERSIALIRFHMPAVSIILTVSPVPLGTTFTSTDIITANTYSKSVLRAAVQTVADEHAFVDYFPSYEMVMNTPHDLAFAADHIHVTPEMVAFVTDCFSSIYLG